MQENNIYDVNILTNENEIVNLKIQGSSEEDAIVNLEGAIEKEEAILQGAESYTIKDIEMNEEYTKQFQESLEEKRKKVEQLEKNIAEYMGSIRKLVEDNEEERKKMENGGFIFLMKKSEGGVAYGHCSKDTMKSFQESGKTYVVPVLEFSAEDLGINL